MAVASLLLCSTVTFYTMTTPVAVSLLPRGNCKYCCPISLREDISFLLYTRYNPEDPQRLYIGGDYELETSYLDRNKTTVFFIHGFTEMASGKSSTAIRKAYIKNTDYNVILVDWSPLSAAPWYDRAVGNTKLTAQYVAQFMKYLISRDVSIDSMHLIGFSLGAEVAGFTGKIITSPKLPRITGLDPAYPLYSYYPRKSHLTSTDARFVDVIHTDGGVFGFLRPLAHADFYPNGGVPVQPGCHMDELVDNNMVPSFVACSHNRAWEYYAESVEDLFAFPANRCTDYLAFKLGLCSGNHTVSMKKPEVPQPDKAYMGIMADKNLRGSFFLQTNHVPPYGLHRSLLHTRRQNIENVK